MDPDPVSGERERRGGAARAEPDDEHVSGEAVVCHLRKRSGKGSGSPVAGATTRVRVA
jgi:hypothetical protein